MKCELGLHNSISCKYDFSPMIQKSYIYYKKLYNSCLLVLISCTFVLLIAVLKGFKYQIRYKDLGVRSTKKFKSIL